MRRRRLDEDTGRRRKVKGTVWGRLLIFALGLALGYAFAVQGGPRLVERAMGNAPELPALNVNQPLVTLGVIVVVVVVILVISRRR